MNYSLLIMADVSPAQTDPAVDSYQKSFDLAVENLERLQAERDKLQTQMDDVNSRLDRVRQGALGLAALIDMDFASIKQQHPRLFGDHLDPRLCITDAVRETLIESSKLLTPVEVKDRVLQLSPAVAGHKNPMASIHAVLRRFYDSGEVVMAVLTDSGSTVYGWVGKTDKANIKTKIARWFTNWERVWEQREDKWQDREEGDEAAFQRYLTARFGARNIAQRSLERRVLSERKKKGGKKRVKSSAEGSLKEN